MSLTMNQFAITTVAGQMDLEFHGGVLSAIVSPNQSGSLVAAQAVKVEDTTGGAIKVLARTSTTDPIFGIIARNPKNASFSLGMPVELAQANSAIYMTALGAISRGASVEIDFSTNSVTPALGINPILGIALDKAVNAGDLIRILLRDVPYVASPASKVASGTFTLAQINAGATLIPGVAGKQITVENFVQRVTGAFTTTTSVNLQSSATSVVVEAAAVAGLTNGAVLVPGSANVTLGAGFGAALPAGEGVVVANVGTAAAGGTSIAYTVEYKLF